MQSISFAGKFIINTEKLDQRKVKLLREAENNTLLRHDHNWTHPINGLKFAINNISEDGFKVQSRVVLVDNKLHDKFKGKLEKAGIEFKDYPDSKDVTLKDVGPWWSNKRKKEVESYNKGLYYQA